MLNTSDQLTADIEKVNGLSIVPTMLEVICRTTGMGFAAIARVTERQWIACSVRDEIQFGLVSGSELQLETTICNEIRDSHKAVIIDHVDKDVLFCNHHTPKMYGFQSYISMPIILKNGEFFGTLCAIDPHPAELNNSKTIGMFSLFAELISFHLQSMELMEQNKFMIDTMKRQLDDSIDENRQYKYISNHNLQEPLRKIRLFSNMILDMVEVKDVDKTKDYAVKISFNAKKISMMIKDLSYFSDLTYTESSFERINLDKLVAEVCAQLSPQLEAKNAIVDIGVLPEMYVIPAQMEQLFYHLISNAVKFSKKDVRLVIKISASPLAPGQGKDHQPEGNNTRYFEIRITDNGIGIEKSQLEKIFDIFSQLEYNVNLESHGIGLAYCRKIIRNHGGSIMALSEHGEGTTFAIILPVDPIT